MMNFTFSTDNVNEAMTIIEAIRKAGIVTDAIADVATDVTTDVPDTASVDTDKADETTVSSDADTTDITSTPFTVGQVQAVLDKMCSMSERELIDAFGYANDKPYRVIKNVGLENAIKTLNTGSVDVNVSLDDALAAIQYIVKDVSVGGMSHNTMEDLFGVRTSKNLFKEHNLNEIVEALKENDLI